MNKRDMANMYSNYLRSEGYAPKIDDDGDVIFKYEGRTYLIMPDERDQQFFRLIFPNFWSIESEAERQKVLAAAGHATGLTKVGKVYIMRDSTWASVEIFLASPDHFSAVFTRSLFDLVLT